MKNDSLESFFKKLLVSLTSCIRSFTVHNGRIILTSKQRVRVENPLRLAALLLAVLLLFAGCGPSGDTEVASNADLRTSNIDTSDTLFAPDRLLQIDIEMDPAEYDVVRAEGRSYPQIFSGCWTTYPDYSHFKATVSVDGIVYDEVDIRKKGFLGSISAGRPSIKLKFDTYRPGRRLESMDRLTLNNDRQDPSHAHQCIVYDMFRAAGLPAPRCNFARVSVNGQDLGIYTNVESVKKHFLRRNFGNDNDEGNLYEAQVADFGEFLKENFQLKTNEIVNDRSDLDTVVEALRVDDVNLPDALAQFVDLDALVDFWAMEAITGHWDGLSGNANNYLLYHDPSSGLFYYIPWGTDGAMALGHPFRPNSVPLYRYATIPSRLFNIPQYRDRYHQRLLELLDVTWDENALNAEMDRIRDLTGTPEADMASSRGFVAVQEERIRSAVAGDIPQTESTIVDREIVCNDSNITTITGTFNDGQGYFEFVDIDGNQIMVPAFAEAPREDGNEIAMNLIGEDMAGIRLIAVIDIETSDFGSTVTPFAGIATTLFLGEWDGVTFDLVGIAGDGAITFDEPAVLGAPPTMHFSADLWLRIPGVRF